MSTLALARAARASASAAFLLALVPALAAQSIKLNDPLPFGRSSVPVDSPMFTADESRIVYFGRSTSPAFNAADLHSVPASGDEKPIRLGGPFLFPVPGRVDPDASSGESSGGIFFNRFETARAGNRVVYSADEDRNGKLELRSVPADGSQPSAVLAAPQMFYGVMSFRLSPDKRQVLYWADAQLFRAPVDASHAPIRVNDALPPLGFVHDLPYSEPFTPDGSACVYVVSYQSEGLMKMFVAPLDGAHGPRDLKLPLAAGRMVTRMEVAMGGAEIVYVADQEEDERFELFCVPLTGGTPRKLNGPLTASEIGMSLDPDRRWVVYLDGNAFFGVRIDGSEPPRRLDPGLGGQMELVRVTRTHVLLTQVRDFVSKGDLYSTPLDGSRPAIRLNGPLDGGVVDGVQVTPDERYVVYQKRSDEDDDLYAVPIDGGAPRTLNEPLPYFGWIYRFAAMDAGVVYLADQERYGVLELYLASVTGDEPPRTLVAGPMGELLPAIRPAPVFPDPGLVLHFREDGFYSVATSGDPSPRRIIECPLGGRVGDVASFQIAPGGEHVVYGANQEHPRTHELFSVRPEERRQLSKLNPELAVNGGVSAYRISPDGTRVVFAANVERTLVHELYSAPLDSTGDSTGDPSGSGAGSPTWPAVKLHGQVVQGGGIEGPQSFAITPDGTRVLFLLDREVDQQFELFAAPIDGSSPALVLSTPADGLDVSADGLELDPDGSHAFFLARPAGTEHVDLYRVPVDGSDAPVRLTRLLNRRAVQPGYRTSADGQWVVFRADPGVRFRYDLFAVPSDASREAWQLNDPPVNGDVHDFAIDARGRFVVYRSDRTEAERLELFSVPLDRSTAPRRLNAELVAGGDVLDFALSSDGDWVVFRADRSTDEGFELFRAPVDGRPAAIRLHVPLVAGRRVLAFEISPDGERVVYLADQEQEGVDELYGVPLRGPARARVLGAAGGSIKLSRQLHPGGSAVDFRITPDSQQVVFRALRNDLAARTLLRVPIRGEEKALEIAGPFLHERGTVVDFAIDPTGTRIVYRADQEELGLVELFACVAAPSDAASESGAAGARRAAPPRSKP